MTSLCSAHLYSTTALPITTYYTKVVIRVEIKAKNAKLVLVPKVSMNRITEFCYYVILFLLSSVVISCCMNTCNFSSNDSFMNINTINLSSLSTSLF